MQACLHKTQLNICTFWENMILYTRNELRGAGVPLANILEEIWRQHRRSQRED